MGNCKDCKHWTPPARPDMHGREGDCDAITDADFDKDPPQLAYMIGYDSSELKTMPEFGCVLFEPR